MDEAELPWQQAAQAIKHADALLFTAGAGMGVDSGLPDFRGNTGFWRAYPPLQELGLAFTDIAQPRWFQQDPELAWGFYGHRLNLYRKTIPHVGFDILRRWAGTKPGGAFVFTSNVDGHFQRAGFAADTICECHGSLNHLQCSVPCSQTIWSGEDCPLEVDETTFRARSPLPACPRCNRNAYPVFRPVAPNPKSLPPEVAERGPAREAGNGTANAVPTCLLSWAAFSRLSAGRPSLRASYTWRSSTWSWLSA